MPALQVRDFPEELYEKLKAYAEREHRSIAQQTIVAVEQMVAEQPVRQAASESPSGYRGSRSSLDPLFIDTEEARAERIKKRIELFERIDARKNDFPPDMPDPVEIVRQRREERDRDFRRLARSVIGREVEA